MAYRLIGHCDVILRLPGESRGTDGDERIARGLGLTIYYHLNEVPSLQPVGGVQTAV
ncbi:hypothetical protein ACZ87_02438 [Candidatus Erwinia dacicola]|uniref:Uncharacterized protein n=1 Tax=Candidatus Erwinia dacicola TaxID=252393 RepID=A0A328TJW4_9GAMM|nr:hypothetical protein ACZ87_02438 [Candidatus Erwinia dacicola]